MTENSFALTAAVLAVAGTVAFLANRAKQPLIVAFILVGVIVGPTVLGWVHEGDPLELLAELGIAILLFLVGLKLDLRLVKTMGRVALVTGIGQVVFTSLVGFALALLFGMPPVVAAYVAIALTFSSTIIIVKLLSDKQELEELHGRIVLGFLIVQDLVVIIVMIVLSGFNNETDQPAFERVALMLGGGAALVIAIAVVMKWVLPWLMPRLASSQELLIVWTVAWAVAIAALTAWMGLSVEVGAFAAGFALASTRYRETISASLSGLRDFMLLFFFIGLGAQLDFSSIGSQVPAAIALSLFVLIGNPLIVLIIMGLMRYPKRVSFLAGLAVAQISEFSLILIALARDIGHVDDAAVGLITLVGIITIGASTYMILYSETLYRFLSPYLGIFERRDASTPEVPPLPQVDAIVYGMGRFGRRLVEELAATGHSVVVVDWDPYGTLDFLPAELRERVTLLHGDADSPDYPEHLPLSSTKWIVSTLQRIDSNKVLATALRRHGATAPIVVTVHSEADRERYSSELAAGTIDLVLEPFRDAADDTIAALRRL